jgi:hypothetical protein
MPAHAEIRRTAVPRIIPSHDTRLRFRQGGENVRKRLFFIVVAVCALMAVMGPASAVITLPVRCC